MRQVVEVIMTCSLLKTLNRIKKEFRDGIISERTAELLTKPYIKEFNAKQKKICKEYKEMTFEGFINE